MLAENTLRDRTIVITGGGTGLGRAMAERFAELGARLVLAARSLPRLEETAREIAERTGASVASVAADVRDPEACARIVEVAVERFGRVDGLVNNAAGNFLCAAEDLSPGGFDAVVGIVMKGSFHCTQAVGRQMIAQGGGGAILSILTTYAWTGSAFVLPSAMAKAGVLAMTRSLAAEWGRAHEIRTNAIAPGPFPTEGAWQRLMPDPAFEEAAKARIPLGRFGDPKELAELAAFLLSDAAAFINGDCVTIDGGEWLMGAGEMNRLLDYDRDQVRTLFQAMRPKKT